MVSYKRRLQELTVAKWRLWCLHCAWLPPFEEIGKFQVFIVSIGFRFPCTCFVKHKKNMLKEPGLLIGDFQSPEMLCLCGKTVVMNLFPINISLIASDWTSEHLKIEVIDPWQLSKSMLWKGERAISFFTRKANGFCTLPSQIWYILFMQYIFVRFYIF